MMGLLGDGWFYISAGGFLVSAVLFVFLLGQYRAAVEAEDEPSAEEADAEPVALSPVGEKVYTPKVAAIEPEPAAAAKTPAPAAAATPPKAETTQPVFEKKAEKPVDPAEITFSGKKAERSETTGGVSPAVVYLQNMKTQMDRLDKEISGLRTIATQQSTHTDLILKKLAELGEQVASVADAQRALAEGAFNAQASAPAVQPPAETAPAAAAPAPQPEPEPVPIAAPPAPEPVEAGPRSINFDLASAAPAERPAPAEEPAVAKASVPASADADKTLVIEPTVKPVKLKSDDVPLPPRPESGSIELKPAAGSEPPAEAPKPARKGPVWPI